MEDYLAKWEEYVAENYSPDNMTHCKLDELYKIADIMKDMAEYWNHKQNSDIMGK